MSTSDPLENVINTIIEILSVVIATALSGTHSRNEMRRLRAETVQRECTVFLQLLRDRDLEHIEDRWEDFWDETMDNFEASNRYLQDLNMPNMPNPGTVSPEFEIWRKMSKEHNNLLEWLPHLKQEILNRAKRSPSLSNREVSTPANRPRVAVRHSFSDFSPVNTTRPVHPQMRNRTYPQPNVSQIGSGWNAGPGMALSRQEPGGAVAGVVDGFSGMSIRENKYPYTQTSPSLNGSVRSHTQQPMRRQSIDIPPNTIPIYAYPNSRPTSHSPTASAPIYSHPSPTISSPANSAPLYNHPNLSHQSINAYQTRPSFTIASTSQQPPLHTSPYSSDTPRTTMAIHRTFSRQSINTSPTQYEPVPFESESRPPPMLHRTSSRHSLDETARKPLKGILKNVSIRTPSEESQSPQNFAPVSQIAPSDNAQYAFRRSWSTSATAGGTAPTERQRIPRGGPPITDRFHLPRFTQNIPGSMSPGASSSSTVPFLDLEHEPRSRYPTTAIARGYQDGTPILLVASPIMKEHGHKKDKDSRHHKSKEGRNLLTKSQEKDSKEKKKRHKP